MAVPRSRILDLMKVAQSPVYLIVSLHLLMISGPMQDLFHDIQPRSPPTGKQSPATEIKGPGSSSILSAKGCYD